MNDIISKVILSEEHFYTTKTAFLRRLKGQKQRQSEFGTVYDNVCCCGASTVVELHCLFTSNSVRNVSRYCSLFMSSSFHPQVFLVMKILCREAEGERVVREVSHISPIVVTWKTIFTRRHSYLNHSRSPSQKTHRSASTIKRVQHIIYLCLSFSLFPLSPQGIMSEYTRITQQRLDFYIIPRRKDTENCFKKRIWLVGERAPG